MKRNGEAYSATILSTRHAAATARGMFGSIASASGRAIAALCVALMLFYAATVPVRAANQIEHAPALMVAHEHDGFGNFSVEAVHDDDHADHHDDSPASDDTSDHLAGGHHHHGDSVPNLLVPDEAAPPAMPPYAGLHGISKNRLFAGLRSIGPERPPRTTSLTA
jgi:hypothetical protein